MMQKRLIVLAFVFLSITDKTYAQAFPLNSFFTEYPAIYFLSPDSANFMLDEILTYDGLKKTIRKECPFSINNAEHLDDIIPFNIFTPLNGLHNQIPWYDTVLQEVKGTYAIDTFVKNWYAYYNKSIIDTETAFFIVPGYGIHNGWHIAAGDPNYHNIPSPIKDKCLQYGDVYTYVKPNEDFRSIWKDISGTYMKLDYDYFTPFADFHGINWAANMMIECTAAIKCLKLKYNKVIVLGLSNGGIHALISGIEGGADGINCASGISVTDYDGFLLPNNENPYYYNLFNKYNLDTLQTKIENSSAYYLFSYGFGDYSTILYEYTTHSLEDTFSSLVNQCHIDFTYNFTGHHFPIAYLDTFFYKVIADTCTSLTVSSGYVEKMNDDIFIFPNPAQKKLTIKSQASEIQSAQVFSMLGDEIVFQRNVHAKETTILLPALPVGNYIVNIVTKDKHYARLVKIVQ